MTRTFSASAALCLTLALAGCSSSTEPVRPAPDIVTVDITTAVHTAQSTIAPGSVVDLTLSVTNNGTSTVRFEFRST
ncbi:MAG TPA: hypothetical protein VFQ05_07565, partial [Candidatus Eisenbacteria bacterium]|nr:hypothetical protein [Candidatus Eisenbacteria bacterium]